MELDCGIRRGRIVGWLRDELALACEGGAWTFVHGGSTCRVSTEELGNRELGKVSLDRTALRVEGDQQAVDEFMRLFTLRFISAGG